MGITRPAILRPRALDAASADVSLPPVQGHQLRLHRFRLAVSRNLVGPPMANHQFDPKKNEMRKLPHGVRNDIPMTFMILRDGKAIFDGDVEELVATKDDYIREYIS